MSITSLIEFDDVSEHTFDAAKLTLLNDKGQLKNLVSADEIIFSNYDTDNDLVSKRGAKTLILGGVDNTGLVSGGVLSFPNEDKSIASYENIINIVDDFSFRCKIKSNVLTIVTDAMLLQLISNVDSSKIIFYMQNQGGGITRIRRQIITGAGANVSDTILALLDLSVDSDFEIMFSNDDDGVTTTNIAYGNNLLEFLFTSPIIDFTDCRVEFSDTTKAPANYDDFQLFKSIAIPVESFPYPEPTDFDTAENILFTTIPFIVDEFISIDIIHEILANTQLKFFITLDGQAHYHDLAAWVVSDRTLAQANTLVEMQAAIQTIPVIKGIGKIAQLASIFKSDLGYATALVELMTLEYKMSFKSGDVTFCNVFGTIIDNAGRPVEGATIRVQSVDKFFDNVFIGPSAKAITNSQGKFSISIPETVTDDTAVDITIEYTEKQFLDGAEFDESIVFEYKNRIIPILPVCQISDLIEKI